METTRSALGVLIWADNAHPQLVTPVNILCGKMAAPSPDVRKHVEYAVMHMLAHPHGIKFGDGIGEGLEAIADTPLP